MLMHMTWKVLNSLMNNNTKAMNAFILEENCLEHVKTLM